MIKEDQLADKIREYIRDNSGYDVHRNYLGMSGINRCSRRLYDAYFNPSEPTEEAYRNCYLGYLWEWETRNILSDLRIYMPDSERELIASFDARFVGHTDGETTDGRLLEIKSVNLRGMDRIKEENRLKPDHYAQVQVYMRYGNYSQALVVIVCRDSLEFQFINLARDVKTGERLERKAQMILGAIDARRRPRCDCRFSCQ